MPVAEVAALFPSCAVEKLCVVVRICGGGSGMVESIKRMLLVAELACLLSQSTQQRRSRCMFRCRETPSSFVPACRPPFPVPLRGPSSAARHQFRSSSGGTTKGGEILQNKHPIWPVPCDLSSEIRFCLLWWVFWAPNSAFERTLFLSVV
jgi:hypothetical protein